jgi:hypothetical protein
VDQPPATPPTKGSATGSATGSAGTSAATPAALVVPRSVELAIRATWGLVALVAVLTVFLWVFREDVIGDWAAGHEGAREVFDQGGREALERAGYAPPSFVPVAATMTVVAAMIVWVLAAVLRLGRRWGQLGLVAVLLVAAYVSVALGFVLEPPTVFSVLAVVALLVAGVAMVLLWHPDTRAFLAGPWADPPTAGSAPTGSPGSPDLDDGDPDRSA